MLATFDPASHAELEAIRRATTSTHTPDLKGCKLYASGQPCPMCLAAIAMTNISEIIYAFDNDDAAPFNYSSKSIYDKLNVSEITFIKLSKLQQIRSTPHHHSTRAELAGGVSVKPLESRINF
jgi:guanine deaminase